ncbi:hypothetical protein GCM10009840_17000 [Pseudolysinimonas kribbensis]|uniref:DUF8094 domain-containing protein n=1 Tax=Pseudolysinimonas kribbensis TaxID=433641 RepID=A0ABQ6K0W7_9MICO|nr:hypothetical protein [Pseudolysinimonas kribbensis]GMA93929.1 hypothetical protein GCM10025881_07530 [Pseudolysinimonas kribbensis]
MRFVIAIVLFVVAAATVGYGLAQRTFLAGPSSVTHEVTVRGDAPLTLVEPASLHAHPGTQTVTIAGSKTVFLAAGRRNDVRAWIGTTSFADVGWSAKRLAFTQQSVTGQHRTAPSPAGSDLWVQESTGSTEITRKIDAPSDVALLVASNGKSAAPARISITWPLDNSAPWSTPLVIGGIGVLLLGLLAFIWALVHARRRRGPRRKTPRTPRNPRPPQLRRGADRKAIEAPQRGRRRSAALGLVAAGAASLLLAGCTSAVTPAVTASPTPVGPKLQPTAVTGPQLDHILDRAEHTVADADSARDATLLATRMDGPALALRSANYTIRGASADTPALPALPTGKVSIALPQQTKTWPRAVFAVVESATDAKAAPVGMMLVQNSPRENYKITYATTLELDVPAVAPATVGAQRQAADNKIGILRPDQLAEAYGDTLINGDKSKYADDFQATGDKLAAAIGAAYKASKKSSLPATATIVYTNTAGSGDTVAFGTNDSGQIVAVEDHDIETVKPTETGAAVNPSGQVKTLSGKSQSLKGITATYGLQLLFYVPPVSAKGKKIQLLGFAQGLIAASEVP